MVDPERQGAHQRRLDWRSTTEPNAKNIKTTGCQQGHHHQRHLREQAVIESSPGRSSTDRTAFLWAGDRALGELFDASAADLSHRWIFRCAYRAGTLLLHIRRIVARLDESADRHALAADAQRRRVGTG